MTGLVTGGVGTWLGTLVDLTIVIGAVAAAYKFRVFDVLGYRYRSEVWCGSTPLSPEEGGGFLFVGNYVIHNTGSRPLRLSRVTLSLRRVERRPGDPVIDSDEHCVEILERKFDTDPGISWLTVGAGERSIFPLRCYLDAIDGPLMLVCTFGWTHGGDPSQFAWLYDPRLPTTWWSEPTPGLPDAWDPRTVVAPPPDARSPDDEEDG